jgi:threonine/homoserine/homoserine lactone efflux protein
VIETILTATILGAFAGLAPGPYTTMVAGTGLERGFKPASRLALIPLISDVPPLIITALILETLNDVTLSLLGVSGGIVVLYIGVRFLKLWRRGVTPLDPDHPHSVPQSAKFWHVALGTLLSPVPWLFWLIVGSPLMLRSWARSPSEGILFICLVFGVNISTATGLAWIASHTRRLMAVRWQKRVLGGVGVALVAAGVFLVFEAAVGDFQSLIDQQERIRSIVEERLPAR